MAHGVTLLMRAIGRYGEYARYGTREPRERDRSLPGKARIKARKAARR